MTFYVEKKLALGPISFGVSPGRSTATPDDDAALSTGSNGEFIRRGSEGFYFGGQDRVAGPSLPVVPGLAGKPFWESLKGDRPARMYGHFAAMIFGFLIMLLGFLVVGRKGAQGWIEVILGIAIIATPIVLTAHERRKFRDQEERERAEREAIEKRNHEMLAAYVAALERARSERSEGTFAQLQREREALTLPYEIWGAAARRTVLLIGFDALARHGPSGAAEIARIMDRASSAAGLSREDTKDVRADLYRTVVWHLLADDHLGPAQTRQIAALREGLAIADDTGPVVHQFQRLRALTPQTLPHVRCTMQLAFHEYCLYETATDHGTLHLTNKRVILNGKRRFEMQIAHASDVVANADENLLSMKTDNPKKPLRLKLDQLVYTAAILDLASSIDERPRGFA